MKIISLTILFYSDPIYPNYFIMRGPTPSDESELRFVSNVDTRALPDNMLLT